ncbi:LysR family transcriptional regulator [Streptomyces pratensis]|uniref:LysR family transcriptional regulator n=1 Tax=Streptomyces pratensis TaxID=1169025 RepID=UPI0019313C08|nr:LysR family transcriptional regulator [Streptomyces pratensis]
MNRNTSPSSMTLVQLRAFVEAERLGSFTAAAQAMDIAQASPSELVRRIESDLDAELFLRGSRTLTLTSAGHELLPYAQEAVDSGARAVRSLGSLGGGAGGGGRHLLSSTPRPGPRRGLEGRWGPGRQCPHLPHPYEECAQVHTTSGECRPAPGDRPSGAGRIRPTSPHRTAVPPRGA